MTGDALATHAALGVLLPFRFEALRLSVTLVDQEGWHAIHSVPSIIEFELEHGREPARFAYNQRLTAQARRAKCAVVGSHAGVTDLFVPIMHGGRAQEILVAGPLRRTTPTSSELVECFRNVSERSGQPRGPEFLRYVTTWLETPLFEGQQFDALSELLTCLAALIAENGDAQRLRSRLRALEPALDEASFTQRMWDFGRALLEPALAKVHASHYWLNRRHALNLRRIPDLIAVGLIAGFGNEADPVEGMIRRHEFQRACVKLARSRGDTASVPMGEHGVALLVASERSEARSRSKLTDLSERAIALGRRHGLKLHIGLGSSKSGAALQARYPLALAAAERAVSQGKRMVQAPEAPPRPDLLARDLRQKLALAAGEPAANLGVRFERYLGAVAAHSGYRVESARAHLEVGLERLVEPLLSSGALDAKSYDEMTLVLHRAAEEAETLGQVFSAYREVVSELERVLDKPTQAHRERSLKRILTFLRDHASEPVTRQQAAQIAGFSPNYFSLLFRRREGVTFQTYLTKLRIERAKQMLTRTRLSVERIGQLAGFASSPHFCRTFKSRVGETPLAYRSRPS